jgi:hypothetical protein
MMPEILLAIVRDPAIALGAAVAAALAAALAWAAFPITLVALRRRLDRIESAQAETAAFMAADLKRLGAMIVQQRADQIGDTLRRSHPGTGELPAAAAQGQRSADTANQLADKLDGRAITQPLRKTVH